jgi:hypothetical protein
MKDVLYVNTLLLVKKMENRWENNWLGEVL